MNKKKHLPIWSLVICDVLLIAATLIIYALFHHVIPAYFNMSSETEAHVIAIDSTSDAVSDITAEDEYASLKDKFADSFSEETVSSENFYSSPGIRIELSEHDEDGQRWYVADIIVADIASIQSGTPGETYSTAAEDILNIAKEHNALAAINGDYASFSSGGTIIRNGVIRKEKANTADSFVLYRDGSVRCFYGSSVNAEECINDGAWQAWSFGPILLDENGSPRSEFSERYNSIQRKNPRTAIGYYEPGHYCFVVVDGRQDGARGMTLPELAQLMSSLGCSAAYNFDGGQSSQITFGKRLVNKPTGNGRVINDIVFVTENTEVAE